MAMFHSRGRSSEMWNMEGKSATETYCGRVVRAEVNILMQVCRCMAKLSIGMGFRSPSASGFL